jgi:DNA-binding NtrC family response regulator
VARVLIVDDDDAIRGVLPRILAHAQHEAEACADGAAALEMCRSWSPDLIITDVYMPEMDGIEFLLLVREEQPDLPIIVISGGGQFFTANHALEDAMQLGAVSTLSKPFQMEEVLAAVDKALSGTGSE